LFQADDELLVNAADFNDLCNSKILSCHCTALLLQAHVFAHVFGVGPVDLLDDFVRDLFLWHANHEPQIQVSGWDLPVSGNSLALDARVRPEYGFACVRAPRPFSSRSSNVRLKLCIGIGTEERNKEGKRIV